LINIQNQTIEVYRPQEPREVLQKPSLLKGELVLPSFLINLKFLWL
jgi:Uma2 family endonuclease